MLYTGVEPAFVESAQQRIHDVPDFMNWASIRETLKSLICVGRIVGLNMVEQLSWSAIFREVH